jgi:predicted glycoside hydrolase/deacetylase ChbG (UPF0249 family)
MVALTDLGLSPDVMRAAVVHVDDLGMCHDANEGGFEAIVNGPATCGSIMVPCPWFADAAARARDLPEVDLGVHLTLTAEYDRFRWGPVLGAAVSSLVDDEGYLPRTVEEVVAAADLDEVDRELRAQIDRALAAGIDVTHLDSHMGTMFHHGFFDIYLQLARDYRLPLFIFRYGPSARVDQLEADGWPIFDSFDSESLDFAAGEGAAHNAARLAGLPDGLSYLICHAARGGEELHAITDSAHAREFERTYYGGEAGAEAMAAEGVAAIGMRPLRDLLRSA